MNGAAIVVEEVQLAVVILAKGDNAYRRACDLRHVQCAVALEASGPQTTGFPVAKYISAAQLGEFSAPIDKPARDAGTEGVGISNQRWNNWCWPKLFRLDGLR